MNIFTATGNLGRDCSTNNVSGTAVCNFAVAVKSGFGDKEQTLWLDCALWGKKAEGRLPEFLVKGQQVAVSGELGTREHEGKTYLTLRVAEVDLVGGRPDAGQQPQQAQTPQQNHQQPQQNYNQGQYQTQQNAQPPAGNFDSFDNDIPF